ncbi:MAG: hypothetical protein HYX69_05205 [Planctomycetia bacterium]|nr:hypothetical protein [Planctomycetia bacterium]
MMTNHRPPRFLLRLIAVAGALVLIVGAASPAWADDDLDEVLEAPLPTAAPPAPRAVEVLLNDDSRLKVVLADEPIEVASRYGTLRIASADIMRIDFAQRLSDERKSELDQALAALASPQGHVRALAARQLLALGQVAYPALAKTAAEASLASKQAERLLEKIKETVDAKELEPRDLDVIQTVDSTISGHIIASTLKVRTAQFGELPLRVADARRLRSQALVEEKPEPEDTGALPDPGALMQYQMHVGKMFKFRVTGSVDGAIWGTGMYTTDSKLSTAAVHAGVLRPGKTGVVKVQIVPSPPSFTGSPQNGVVSYDYGAYPMAYRIVKPR